MITPTIAAASGLHALSWHLQVSHQSQNGRHPQERGEETRELSRETSGQRDFAQAFDAVGSELEPSGGRVRSRQACGRASQRSPRGVQWKLVDQHDPSRLLQRSSITRERCRAPS
jgi:hypothetical protein